MVLLVLVGSVQDSLRDEECPARLISPSSGHHSKNVDVPTMAGKTYEGVLM